MTKTASLASTILLSAAGMAFASGLEGNRVISEAGLPGLSAEIQLPAVAEAMADRPGVGAGSAYAIKTGTIKGAMNHSPVDITIDKINWTIKGGMNLSPVDIRIDHQAGTVAGGANLSPVSLKFAWSPEEITFEGGANLSPVKYTVNWKNGVLEGYTNHSPLRLEFDMQEGVVNATIVKVTGYVNHAPVGLTYNKVNGHIGGGMNLSPVDLTLVNCDLYDFLTHFFLFAK